MKRRTFLFGTLIAGSALATPRTPDGPEVVVTRAWLARVDGLVTPEAAYRLERSLVRVEGIQRVRADARRGVATVHADARLPRDRVWRAFAGQKVALRSLVPLPTGR